MPDRGSGRHSPSSSPKAQLERRNRVAQEKAFQGLFDVLGRLGQDVRSRTEAVRRGKQYRTLRCSRFAHFPSLLATQLLEDYRVLLSMETDVPLNTQSFTPHEREVDSSWLNEFGNEQFLASGSQRQW